jgi:DEAD/DEAH box helicase domain-containing protein
MKVVYLDVETQYIFEDFPGGQNDRNNTIRKLKIAVIGTLAGETFRMFGESQIMDLLAHLRRFDKVVGHNLIGFDYLVLGSYFQFPESQLGSRGVGLIGKTHDTMLEFSHIVNASLNVKDGRKAGWVALDDIAKRNFGLQKPHDGKLIPKMWRDGKHEEVISYLRNDLEITKRFYLAGVEGRNIKYDHKTYSEKTNKQVSQGEKEVFVKW